jgi:hypothetical protein
MKVTSIMRSTPETVNGATVGGEGFLVVTENLQISVDAPQGATELPGGVKTWDGRDVYDSRCPMCVQASATAGSQTPCAQHLKLRDGHAIVEHEHIIES